MFRVVKLNSSQELFELQNTVSRFCNILYDSNFVGYSIYHDSFFRTSATSFVKVGRKGSVMNDPSPNFTHSRNFATFQKYEINGLQNKKGSNIEIKIIILNLS